MYADFMKDITPVTPTDKQQASKKILDWCDRMNTYLNAKDEAYAERMLNKAKEDYDKQLDWDYMAHTDIR